MKAQTLMMKTESVEGYKPPKKRDKITIRAERTDISDESDTESELNLSEDNDFGVSHSSDESSDDRTDLALHSDVHLEVCF